MRMSNYISLILLFFVSGCSLSYQTTGYLPDYSNLTRDETFKSVWLGVGEEISINSESLHVLYLSKPSFFGQTNLKFETELANLLHDRLYWRALTAFKGMFIIIKEDETKFYEKIGYEVWRLDSKITDVRCGWGAVRYLIGFYQGAAKCQVEGKLISPDNITLHFVAVKKEAGKPYFVFNPRVLSSKYCLRIAVDKIAADLTSLVASKLLLYDISL